MLTIRVFLAEPWPRDVTLSPLLLDICTPINSQCSPAVESHPVLSTVTTLGRVPHCWAKVHPSEVITWMIAWAEEYQNTSWLSCLIRRQAQIQGQGRGQALRVRQHRLQAVHIPLRMYLPLIQGVGRALLKGDVRTRSAAHDTFRERLVLPLQATHTSISH